jgi:hypothetical protein
MTKETKICFICKKEKEKGREIHITSVNSKQWVCEDCIKKMEKENK